MKTMKALFSSALALIAILMLSLFTSCSGPEKQPAPEASLVRPTVHQGSDMGDMDHDTVGTETPATDSSPKASPNGIELMNATICTGIEEHAPVGAASEFTNTVGRVYLHTRVTMPEGRTGNIRHVWKRDGKVVSTVELAVKGPSFRTWSYKTITEKMTGSWTVDVMNASGELLESVAFQVQ